MIWLTLRTLALVAGIYMLAIVYHHRKSVR